MRISRNSFSHFNIIVFMKKKGACAEFNDQRDRELIRAFNHVFQTNRDISLEDAYFKAPTMAASRFWVSEKRAATVMGAMLRGASIAHMNPKKQEMYREIFSRVQKILAEAPGTSITEATFMAVNSEAPEFYLTPKSARVIIYNARA